MMEVFAMNLTHVFLGPKLDRYLVDRKNAIFHQKILFTQCHKVNQSSYQIETSWIYLILIFLAF
jgi:hypothetical protein